ncbi:MAG: purine-nucleoside phosphorylase [Deltaproteobacteria bacterium]|nr:MAG: purine-nucleoside phosphorylase [Deltaproteobacteria bacterium]
MFKLIEETSHFLISRISEPPVIGLITGTGLGDITHKIDVEKRIPYSDIPHFPRPTAEGHRGTLVFGKLAGRKAVAMEGRFHVYEGYAPEQVGFPVRVMSKLGIETLFISSAAGGLNPQFEAGDIMIVTDHINLTGKNPLIGPNLEEFGPRFPDMSEVYDRSLVSLAREKALESGIHLREGVYVGILGPSLETPAETRFLRMIGADAVGMSTVPEVIVGVHCGLKIVVIVAITNVNLPDCMKKTSIEEVIRNAEKAGPKLATLWEKIASALPGF